MIDSHIGSPHSLQDKMMNPPIKFPRTLHSFPLQKRDKFRKHNIGVIFLNFTMFPIHIKISQMSIIIMNILKLIVLFWYSEITLFVDVYFQGGEWSY